MHVVGKKLCLNESLNRNDFLQASGAFLLSRIIIYLMVYLGVVHYPTLFPYINLPLFTNIPRDSMEIMCQFDCSWFVSIALDGYQLYPDYLTTGHAANWAFLPFYPMLGRALTAIPGVDILLAFYIITNVSFFIALLLWLRFLKFFKFTEANKSFGLFFLCFLPYSTYYVAPYTESLFLALSLAAFINAYQGRMILAAIFAMGMTATKNIGVMFVFPLLIMAWQQYGLRELFNLKSLRTQRLILAIMLIPLPMFVFQDFLWHVTGDALAFKNIQLAWGRELGNPFGYMMEGFEEGGYKTYFSTVFIVSLLLIIYLFVKKRPAEATYLLIGTIIPVSTSVNAFPRYLFGMVPCLLAIVYLTDRHPWLRNFVLATSSILCVYFAVAWGHGKFFTV
jgi:hypothetical protein